ncbi:MAG: hypothetical protein O3C47_09105 [Bacteroidetes bacterium]|nr:hypothetical protein [Bacteroidota bacterium]
MTRKGGKVVVYYSLFSYLVPTSMFPQSRLTIMRVGKTIAINGVSRVCKAVILFAASA